MEPNKWIGAKAPASPEAIAAIEQERGFTLPADYKAHLLQHNGGWPDRQVFVQEMEDGRPVERDLRSMFSVAVGESTLEDALLDLDELHPDLVPFGDESGGDVFVLSVGPRDYGAVYYVAHEFYTPPEYEYDEDTDTSTPPAPLDYGPGVHFLAPSFTAFLDGLVAGTPA